MGQPINFVSHGRQGAPKIVFIHGNMASTKWWRLSMELLQNDFTMLAVDLRGYGQSPDGPEQVTLADHARDIHTVVTAQGFEPFILVGHSLGGAVAMEFASQYPEMLTGLVLLDAAPVEGMKDIDYSRVEMMLADKSILAMALRYTLVKPVEEDYFAELLADAYRGMAAVIPNTRALDGADFTNKAKGFDKPVLVVHGEKDMVVPLAEAEKTAQTFPKARLAVIEGVGHNPQVEEPVEFVKALKKFACDL